MPEQTIAPVQNSIYSFLKDNGLTSKSEADFNTEYADSAKAKELYGFFTENQLTAKDFDSFYKDNFSSVQAAPATEQPEVSASAGLHSVLPYVNVPKNQVIPSIAGAKEDISYDPNALPEIGSEGKIDNVIPQAKSETEQYFDPAIQNTGGAQIQKEKPLDMIDQLKVDYIEKSQGKQAAIKFENELRNPTSVGGEFVDQFQSGSESLLAATYGTPGYLYDYVASGFRGLGMDVNSWKDSWAQEAKIGDVDVNPLSFLEKQKNELLNMAAANDIQVRKSNPGIDKGIVELFESGDVKGGFRNIFSSISQSAPSTIAMMATGGMSTPAQIGLGALVFGSQNMNEADRTGDYGNTSRDAVLAISGITGAFESTFETLLGAGAVGKGIINLIKSEGKEAVEKELKKGISKSFAEMVIKNPWLAPFGESFEEMGTTLSQNIVNKYSGYKPDIKIGDGVFDSGIVGFTMGSGFSGAIGGTKRLTNQNSQQPSEITGQLPDSTPQFTVNPRDTKAAELRQAGEQYASRTSGNIETVEIITPEGTENVPGLVVGSFEQKFPDGTTKKFYKVQEALNPKVFHNLSSEQLIESGEQSVDDFVNSQMGIYDQTTQQQELIKQNQIQIDGKQYVLTGDQTEEGYIGLNPETGEDITIPFNTVDAIRNSGQQNANVITETYGKAKVTGIKNEDGSTTLTEPSSLEQANSLLEQVEQATGGNATVQAELIPNEDATAPQQFQLSIIPKVNEQINNEYVTGEPSGDNGLKAEPTDGLFSSESTPAEKKITTQPIGKDQIDFIEGEEFDEVVPTDKMPLEKALPILEKKFKDHPKVVVVAEKVQVEVPGKVIKGETKWDDDVVEPSTTKTVIKSIKIVPKEVIARQKQADTEVLLDILDEFNATPQTRQDKQKAGEIEGIAKQLGYQTERDPMNQIRLFDNSGTISKPKVSKSENIENQNQKNVSEITDQLFDNQPTTKTTNSDNEQIISQNEKPVEIVSQVDGQNAVLQGEDTPPKEQGKGISEGLEENVNENIISTGQPVTIPTIADPVADEISQSGINLNPTDAQKEAGNYKKAHISVQGMDITIENPKGSVRKGKDEDGKAWENVLQSHYGYFKRTTGKDNDHIDTFIGSNPESQMIFVVDQNNPKTGKFDESKVMTGFNTPEEAKAAYLANYEPNWKGFGSITPVPVEQFKEWLNDGAKQHKPFSEYKSTPDPVEVKPARKPNSITGKAKEVIVDDSDIQGLVLQYFINGGTIHPDEISRMFRQSSGEVSARRSYSSKVDGKTVNEIAHSISETLPERISDRLGAMDVYNFVEDVIKNNGTPSAMARTLLARYSEDPNQGYSEEWLAEQVRIEDEERQAEINVRFQEYTELEKNGQLPTENELIELFLPENTEENGQEIDSKGSNGLDRPVNPEGNDQIGENLQGSEPGVQGENEGENVKGEVKPPLSDVLEAGKKAKQEKKPDAAYGANNKIVSNERAEELRKRLRDKLNNLNVGFDPELLAIGTVLAAYHIESGARKFADFSKRMIEDVGEAIKPYLKSIYNGARDIPGMEEIEAEMTEYSEVKKADIDEILKPVEIVPETKQTEDDNVKQDNNNKPDGKQRILQRNNKRVSKPALPSLFDRMDEGGIEGNVGLPGDKVSGTYGAQQQPTGRKGNVLPGDANLLEPALVDFNAEDNDTKSFNPSQKYNDNIKAIETVISLINEKRKATSEEKEILSKYVGFGGLKDVLLNPELTEGWGQSNTKFKPQVKRIIELSEAFDQATGIKGSLSSIKGSILNAHFTSSNVIRSVYDGISKLGFKGGRILEPSSGIGNFVTFMPNQIKSNSTITAVELDDLTGHILKFLHDDVNVKVSGIQDANIPNNSQDLVISNVPFGNYKIFDKSFKGEKAQFQNRIHNYFFAKAVDIAREGGLIAFVTSKGVMDAPGNESLRRYLDQNTEFLGAVRLPNNAFKNNANTEVVTDIIFLKKNSTINKNNPNFINVFKVNAIHKDGEQQEVGVNQYFVDRPENMLGNIVAGGLYSRDDYTVENKNEYDLSTAITKALPSGVYKTVTSDMGLQANDSQETIDAIKEGNIEITGDRLVRKEEGQLAEIKINEPTEKIQHYIKLRNSLMHLIYSEYLGKQDNELDLNRRQLNADYENFVKKYGKLDKSATKIAKQDADGYNVLSLEVKGKQDGKADIFRQRTIQPIYNKLTAENIDEAIVVSLYEHANINIERIAELLNLTIPEVLENAKGKIFEQPTGGFVTRDEYLSGNVKLKLKQAEQAVKDGNTEFQNNIDELLNVIPKDIPAMSIEARLGSRWIPQEVYSDFARYLFNFPPLKMVNS